MSYEGHIVVVDDDPQLNSLLKDFLTSKKYQVHAFIEPLQALKFLNSKTPESEAIDLVISDLRMPDVDGISVLHNIKSYRPDLPVILMTAHASLETAIEGLKRGAFDYLIKPFVLSQIHISIERALQFSFLKKENNQLKTSLAHLTIPHGIVGKSQAIRNLIDQINTLSQVPSNAMIQGESGTGKELVARAIHDKSSRNKGPFVAVNCSAIPENLFESEFFGHVKGAFTGAHENRAGLFEEANGGTLFLDEIGDLTLSVQAKLLRVLQERKIRAVGSSSQKDINVRIICATHKRLDQMVAKNEFRQDLFFRLAVIPLEIPPLRERKEDISLLAQHFLAKYATLCKSPVKQLTPSAVHLLTSYQWPGNVRELENVLERSLAFCTRAYLDSADIKYLHLNEVPQNFPASPLGEEKIQSLDEVEKGHILRALEFAKGKKEKTSQLLGISRRTLYRKLLQYELVNYLDDAEEEA
ncbi:MAG: sigma-54-dependent transcriptional regulator [Pseudobdellovibrionaceae bacterium]